MINNNIMMSCVNNPLNYLLIYGRNKNDNGHQKRDNLYVNYRR